jgi:two-component system sensor histidine kinase BraS/BceS
MKIKQFVKDKFSSIVILFISLFVFALLFYFMELDFEIYNFALQLILFFAFIYLLGSYFYFKKEEEKSESRKELEEKVKELEAEIQEERNNLQEYFLMWVHQIKTPITAATLISKDDEQDAEERCSKIRQELIHIEDYTNMTLNYLKVMNPSSDLEFSEVKLDDIIRKLLKRYSILFIYNHIQLTYETIEEKVLTDAKWTGVMVEQILANAIKYSKGKEIKIYFDKDENRLYISDTGMGIREEDIPKIFDKGFSGFNGRLNEKSTGLGLFLVNKISKRLNQEVGVESELSKGSSFYISFNELNLTNL